MIRQLIVGDASATGARRTVAGMCAAARRPIAGMAALTRQALVGMITAAMAEAGVGATVEEVNMVKTMFTCWGDLRHRHRDISSWVYSVG
jgi:hypothetical protein